jgi:hypothetical protein
MIFIFLLNPSQTSGMLRQKFEAERKNRLNSKKYQNALIFFNNYFYETMHFLKTNPEPFLFNNLSNKLKTIPQEKLNKLQQLLTQEPSLLDSQNLQVSLLEIAEKKIQSDCFSGKILYFHSLALDKKTIYKTFNEIKEYTEIEQEIAEKIIAEEDNEYKQTVNLLFFEILTYLVNTNEFEQVFQWEKQMISANNDFLLNSIT